MKREYFAPEMEEVKVEEPVVLEMAEGTQTTVTGCPDDKCTVDDCPLDGLS